MAIDFVIPAKIGSTRVLHKNWREFYNGRCLVELLVDKLRAAGAVSIYVSCEACDMATEICSRLQVTHLVRDPKISDNAYPVTKWIRDMCNQVPGDSDIALCSVCDPLFDSYKECLRLWNSGIDRSAYDSLSVTYQWVDFLMTAGHQPVGWSFGDQHTVSQLLPKWSLMPFTLSVLPRQTIADTGYYIGRKPYWFTATNRTIDINTPDDFEAAAALYTHYEKVKAG